MKQFFRTHHENVDNNPIQVIELQTEQYRTYLIGEMKLFDLNLYLELAYEKKAELKDKKKIAECAEFIKLVNDEIKCVNAAIKKAPSSLDNFTQILASPERDARLKRVNQLSNHVLGVSKDLSGKIHTNSKKEKELKKIKDKIAAVVIVINILNSKDNNESKLNQVAYHARNSYLMLKDKNDSVSNEYWKTLESLEKVQDRKKTYQQSI